MSIWSYDGVVPVVDPTAFVHPDATLIGDVIVGPCAYVGPQAVLRGDFGHVEIGAGANVQETCVVHAFPNLAVEIGPSGHIGHGAVLHGCRIGRNVLVGMNAVVMDEAEIGESSIVGALAFVKAGTRIPPRSMVVGAPARILRALTDAEVDWKTRGTGVYQRLALDAPHKLAPAQPLPAPEPNRRRIRAPDYDPLIVERLKLGD
jgi:phenylacetic acid degradation protein